MKFNDFFLITLLFIREIVYHNVYYLEQLRYVNCRCLQKEHGKVTLWVYQRKGETKMFHENLKTLRKNKGMSQEQLAVNLHVVRQTVSKWEKQLSVPDAETLMKIAEVLEVSVNDLLGETVAERADMSDVAEQLSRLNDLVATQIQDRRNLGRKIKEVVIIALFILFIAAIYPSWGETWHEFGRNLYHFFND